MNSVINIINQSDKKNRYWKQSAVCKLRGICNVDLTQSWLLLNHELESIKDKKEPKLF